MNTPGKKFRQAIADSNPLMIVGAVNAYCAKMAESAAADSAILAQYAFTAPTIIRGLLSAIACLNFLPGVFIRWYCTLQ